MNAAISQLRQQAQATRLNLVGYSGGGTMAALLAARRTDVQRLITVAGNLDPASWVQRHRLTPLNGSLNPADQWQALAGITQMHFVGMQDATMPEQVARSYRNRFPADAPITLEAMPGFDHQCCWVDAWPDLWRRATLLPKAGGG
jgi:dienelactone hydrolase